MPSSTTSAYLLFPLVAVLHENNIYLKKDLYLHMSYYLNVMLSKLYISYYKINYSSPSYTHQKHTESFPHDGCEEVMCCDTWYHIELHHKQVLSATVIQQGILLASK